ncbi:MAG: cupin domain-containing protein [Luteibacter sp.]|uniref:cupin domain-containing protein n=1 Tax=Luteibacter sp. TaxID=1886636 RepID=UPI0028073E42|nr:cupin domain-containing protein [Luteibacter sp.]MDQ7995249.1 cupin domain-containing protein [Luteibacter sp.]
MRLNDDFSLAALVARSDYVWTPSPQVGVTRMMLDRVGGERARATSIVRYDAGSSFPRHGHPGGEEILVLSGVFTDDTGSYPAGWYLRNPPGSSHAPSSAEGAVIFVKLWQMDASDDAQVRINTRDPARWQHQAIRSVCTLHERGPERVALHRVDAAQPIVGPMAACAELLVIAGMVTRKGESYPAGSWLRLPTLQREAVAAGPQGATVYVKTGGFCLDTPAERRA